MRGVTPILAKLTAVLGMLVCATGAVAEGPPDLVGTWKGYRIVRVKGGAEERRDYSIAVKSVKEADGKWVAEAVDGQGRPLPMTVSVVEGRIQIEYMLGNQSLRLDLQRGTVLIGEARQRGSAVNQNVRLEKQAR